MLARIAASLRARSSGIGAADREDEGGPIVIDENCLVSVDPVKCCLKRSYTSRSCEGYIS